MSPISLVGQYLCRITYLLWLSAYRKLTWWYLGSCFPHRSNCSDAAPLILRATVLWVQMQNFIKKYSFYQHHYLLLTDILGLVTVTLCHGLWSQTRLQSISRLLNVIITSITSWQVTFNITVNFPELHDSERLLCHCNKYLSV